MIKIVGKIQHPRYNQPDHPISLFNAYVSLPFYRVAILMVIKGISSYQDLMDTESILKNALDEAAIWEPAPENPDELDGFKGSIRSFVENRKYFESFRGALFEQVMKITGPPVQGGYEYDPSKNCVEEAKIFSELHGYENGGETKDVDLAFHNGERVGKDTILTDQLIACEVKCNINTFIETIIRSQVPAKSKNFEKLKYLNEMKAALKEYASIFIISLSEPRAATMKLLSEYGLNRVTLWSPL